MTTTLNRKRATHRPPLWKLSLEDQLAAQTERAKQEGVDVKMVGKLRATGKPCWLVPSQREANAYHIVSRAPDGSLQCDCWACQHDHLVCIHRAAVYLFLKNQRSTAPAISTIMVCCVIGEHENCHIDCCTCKCHQIPTQTPNGLLAASTAPQVGIPDDDAWGRYQERRMANFDRDFWPDEEWE